MLMEHILRDYARHNTNAARLLADLVAEIRPRQNSDTGHAAHAVQALCHVLNSDPGKAQVLRDAIVSLLVGRKPISLYVDSGIQPNSGFFTELSRRIGHKILPDAINPAYLKDLFGQIFPKGGDETWVAAVPDDVWLQLVHALRFHEVPADKVAECQKSLLDAAQVLSYRLAASGLEPELIRNHPEIEYHDSPFITQSVELQALLAMPLEQQHDVGHILVMLDQCREVIAKIRRNSSQTGTSVHLTFLLQRMSQQVRRLESLLGIIKLVRSDADAGTAMVQLFKTLVSAERHKNDVRQHFRENVELMALRVTENASRTGEHYITETRSEYFGLMRSAMGAGVIIALMTMLKIIAAKHHYAPLTEAILFSLNYGLGFALIHILHFTVATKQPAMTAAAIAASIDASDRKNKNLDKLVTIIAQTFRSQTIAILGNVMMAVPVAMLVGWLILSVTGQHFITPEKAHALLDANDPFHSGAVFYAAIAGVCLFLSGLIAGYHDNLAVYNKIPQRLRALGWLEWLLGPSRLDRVARYVENNLGALAGNFYFGCLLGGMSGLGVLLGLPIDIRHIAFASAFTGYSFVALDFLFSWQVLVTAILGIWLIGTTNLVVSFSLALYVAMKSRKVTFAQWRLLLKTLAKRFIQNPALFLLPPKRDTGVEVEDLERAADEHAHVQAHAGDKPPPAH
ncbi:site-specific recombinase [Methylobacillus flagellatus]|uniref:site-specific recombinase n=1 Tax=Methylobacillus flagellatus TaxID=405 RepID=UPI002853EF9A|nr:site-specific recombinase [Methylobacillus flagellatus]MDR5170595.1 site-specific recombinase [Methylobacillus flagellatus]